MTTPKAVIFDLGKVLVDFDYAIAARKVAARSPKTGGNWQRLMDCLPIMMRYERGLLTTEEFFNEIRAATGFTGTLAEFGADFGDIFWPIEPMIQLHAELRQHRVPTYIFSNTNDLAVTHVRRTYPFYNQFDGYVLSYEHGAMKPEPALYEVVERVTGLRGAELVYLDDRPENIETGAARGWQAILHEDPDKSRAAVRKLGLLDHS